MKLTAFLFGIIAASLLSYGATPTAVAIVKAASFMQGITHQH